MNRSKEQAAVETVGDTWDSMGIAGPGSIAAKSTNNHKGMNLFLFSSPSMEEEMQFNQQQLAAKVTCRGHARSDSESLQQADGDKPVLRERQHLPGHHPCTVPRVEYGEVHGDVPARAGKHSGYTIQAPEKPGRAPSAICPFGRIVAASAGTARGRRKLGMAWFGLLTRK
jgi:hypothetical protein